MYYLTISVPRTSWSLTIPQGFKTEHSAIETFEAIKRTHHLPNSAVATIIGKKVFSFKQIGGT